VISVDTFPNFKRLNSVKKGVFGVQRSVGRRRYSKCKMGLSRESLYKSLSQDGNPSFNTVSKVLNNLGFQLSIKQKIPA